MMPFANTPNQPFVSHENEKEQIYSPEDRIWRPVSAPEDVKNAKRIPSETFRSAQVASLGLSHSDITLLRDNFSLTTWLMIGAVLQGILFSLYPFRYTILPVAVMLGWRISIVLLRTAGLLSNPNMKGVVLGKYSTHQPDENGKLEGEPSQKGMVVFLLAARCNHPLGMFAPGFKDIADLFTNMVNVLERDAEKYDFHTSTPWIGRGGDRDASQEILTIFYFNSIDGLHRFAQSPAHAAGWDYTNRNMAKLDHIALRHELFYAPAESAENINLNFHRSGVASQNVKLADGSYVVPLVDATEGQYRTSKGRLNMVDHGTGNDKYKEPPYQHARLFCPAMPRS